MLVYDLDGNEHDKNSVDVRECVQAMGWTNEKPEPKKPVARKPARKKTVRRGSK